MGGTDINQPGRDAAGEPRREYERPAALAATLSILTLGYKSTPCICGLQLSWNRAFRERAWCSGSRYTLAKSMDGGCKLHDIAPDTYNTSNLWGPSEFDVRHMARYQLPVLLPFFKRNRNLQASCLAGGSLVVLFSFLDRYAFLGRHSTTMRASSGLGNFGCWQCRPVLGAERTSADRR